jgi:hypothetical protein
MKDPLISYLEYEAKNKPHIKKLVDNVHNMTDAEIDAADTPLPWFKIALKRMRDLQGADSVYDFILNNTTFSQNDDIDGVTYRYLGEDFFARVSTGMEVEVKTGEVFWCPKTGGAWIQETFCKTIPQQFRSCNFIGEMKKSGYISCYKDEISKRHGIEQSPESIPQGVRFYRH